MPSVIPRDFLKPTAVCSQTDRFGTILNRFQHEQLNELVVLDEGRAPVGIIFVRSLLMYWFGDRTSGELLQTPISDLPWAIASLVDGLPPLIQSITPLHLAADLQHLETECQRHDPPWAAVDESGQFLGLLDATQVWKFFANQRRDGEDLSMNLDRLSHLTATSASVPGSSETTRVPSSLLWETFSLISSVEILRRLPLPLMLQTGDGQIVVQNSTWQQRLGELQNPTEVWQSAAPLLEQVPVDTGDRNGICQLGDDGNTCDCVCTLKGGGERVWRFIKIPFGLLTVGASDVAAMVQPVTDSYINMDRVLHSAFHLAHLNASTTAVPSSRDRPETLWLILAQDATEQYRMDQELAAKNADLVQLNRLKDEFLSCISHELKTPLTAILGLSTLLKDRMIGEMNQRQLRYAQLIYQSGRHLMSIVNDILDLARIETGQLELSLELVNVVSACDRAYTQACQHNASVETHAGDRTHDASPLDNPPRSALASPSELSDLPAFTLVIQPGLENIVADELRLRQMLSNLLSNALKFTPVDGSIGLQVERWGHWVAFTVWDTGIGIPSDKQHLIFQKFQQLESPLTRQFDGTGLGLVLTQRLARLHGGDVTFTSVEGQGSQFTILLPPIPSEAIAQFDPEDLAHISTGPKSPTYGLILVVESAPQLLDSLTSKLTSIGYKVAIARSGTEALEKARCLQPSATFLNPTLPLLSGWDVLTLLKSDPSTAHIPTVVMTTPTAQRIAQHHDADEFLSVPIQDKHLMEILERLLLQHNPQTQPKAKHHITVLYVRSADERIPLEQDSSRAANDLHDILSPLPCKILEVDGMDQVELITRVWKPNIVLLSEAIAYPEAILRRLVESPRLRNLPLVTLTPATTQAANQYSDLKVYPCLVPLTAAKSGQLSALAQVIQVATGLTWTPHLLIIDLMPQIQPDCLQPFIENIQSLGYTYSISRSWLDIAYALQSNVIDLMVLCVPDLNAQPSLIRIVYMLEKLELRPPLIVWQYQTIHTPEAPLPTFAQISSETQSLLRRLERVSTCILPPAASLEVLVRQINGTISGTAPP